MSSSSIATISTTLRITLQSLRAVHGDNIPGIDNSLYDGRTYTLASASCFTAAYAAADHHRDQIALQFYNFAVKLASTLSPLPSDDEVQTMVDNKKKTLSKEELESFDEKDEFKIMQTTLNSQRKACHTAIASNYGALMYLARQSEPNISIYLYRDAYQACRTAHEEARSLRHTSDVDIKFGDLVEQAVKSIGMFYNQELTLCQDIKLAEDDHKAIPLTPEHYILCSDEQRATFSKQDVEKMVNREQANTARSHQHLTKELESLQALNTKIAEQSKVATEAEARFKEVEEEFKKRRIELENATGALSKLSKERSEMRARQTTVDALYYTLQQRLQTIVNLRAQQDS